MRRRRLLGVLATVGLTGSTGCLFGGGGGGDDSPGGGGTTTTTNPTTTTTSPTTTTNSTATTTGSTTTASDPVERAIAKADEHLETATKELSPSPTPTTGNQSIEEFDPFLVREWVDRARAKLDEAANASPTEAQSKRIEKLRAIADFLDAYVALLVVVKNATVQYRNAISLIDEGKYGQAKPTLEQVRSKFGGARDRLEVVDERSSEVRTHLEVGESVYNDALRDLMGEPSRWNSRFTVFSLMVDGQIRRMDALQSYREGASAYDEGSYDAAADVFSDAETAAADAKGFFDDAATKSLLMAFGDDPSFLSCRMAAAEEAATKYRSAARAASEGNSDEAETARSAARKAFNRKC